MIYGSYGVFLGDRSNSEAEYEAFLQALSDAAHDRRHDVIFRVDSLLLCRQMNGEWACRSPTLIPLYTQCLSLLSELRLRGGMVEVCHVYREFNTDADGIANEVLDNYNPRLHPSGVVVSFDWGL